MKKASTADPSEPDRDDPLPEYRFDYRKAKPNRFAGESRKREVSVRCPVREAPGAFGLHRQPGRELQEGEIDREKDFGAEQSPPQAGSFSAASRYAATK